jgi:hypothetical protein
MLRSRAERTFLPAGRRIGTVTSMSHARTFALLLAVGSIASAGCSAAPADVSGSYSIALTNDANGCMFMSWNVGDTTTGVPLTITQSGTSVTGNVGGAGGIYLDALFGGHTFLGNVSGSHVDMVLHGTNATMASTCRLMLDAHASVELVGDTLTSGTITYTYVTNGDSTCPIYTQTCSSVQRFNGTRPPR